MKQKILIACCLLCSIITNAQLTTNLVLNPRASARLSEWALNKSTITLIVTNIQSPRRGKIKATLKSSDGTTVSTTNLNTAKTFVFGDGNTILNADAVFPLEVQQFVGKYVNALNRTGKLPADNYQLCVELVEEATFARLAPEQCRSFFVSAAQLPICMMPAKDQELDAAVARTAITFRWTPLIPKPQAATNYRLQVFEVLENQTAMQALRSNQPLLDQVIIERTQFIWQPQLPMIVNDVKDSSALPSKDLRFIWSIQTLDDKGEPIAVDANYEGRSEPIPFIISNRPKGKGKKNYVGHVTLMK
jgi:hypothetical protein